MYRAVFLVWADSADHGDGWHDLSDVVSRVERLGPLEVQSVGFIVHEDERSLTLAQSWSPDDDGTPARVCAPTTIPKSAVMGEQVLMEPKNAEIA